MACKVTGSNARLALKKEAAYGTKATGNFAYLPFLSLDLAAKDSINDDPILGFGRDTQRPARDIVDVTGNVVVPVDVDSIGWWLFLLLGPATVTGTGPYTHLWKSGLPDLPSFTLEVQHTDATPPLYTTFTGVIANSIALDFAATGRPRLTVSLIAKSEEEDAISDAGAPTTPQLTWFHQKVNSLKKDASDLAKIMAFSLTVANNYDVDRFVGGNGEIGCIAPGIASARGSLRARFIDASLHQLATNATIFDLEAGWTNSEAQKLLFELDQAELLRGGRSISGPGGVEKTYEVVGSKDPAEGDMLRVTLVNAISAYG